MKIEFNNNFFIGINIQFERWLVNFCQVTTIRIVDWLLAEVTPSTTY